MPKVEKRNIAYQQFALGLGILLFAVKFSAFYLTKSNSILTDAIEGLANVLGAAFGLFAMYYANQPRDLNHPYGHGKIEFLSSGFEGALVLVAGVSMIIKSTYALFIPHDVTMNLTGLLLVLVAGLLNFVLGKFMISQGEKTDSLQLQAGGFHLVSDGYTTAGLLVGMSIVWLTDYEWLDNAIAIALGAMISVSALKIIKKATDGILDKSDVNLIEKIAKKMQANRAMEWVDLHHVRIVKYGAFYHMDAHLTLPWYFTLEQAHAQVDAFEDGLKNVGDKKIEPAIHFEPCNPNSCAICKLSSCTERTSEFVKEVVWDKSHILEDRHHSL